MTVIKFEAAKALKNRVRDKEIKIAISMVGGEVTVELDYEYVGDALLLLEMVRIDILDEAMTND